MKILVLSNVGSGLYSFRRELFEALVQRGDRVTVAIPKDDYAQKFREMGCEHIPVEVARRSKNPLQDLMLLGKYIKIIRSVRPDVVLTYTVKPNIYGGLACRMTNTPYLANVTGLGTAIENGGVFSRLVLKLYKAGLKKARCVFFQNAENRASFEQLGVVTGSHRLIPGSGVNLEQHSFEPYPEAKEPVHFLYAGRIMRDKGINELLEAAEIIRGIYPDVQFDLIGGFDENFRPILDRAAEKGNVHYWGRQSDVHAWYRQSWAVIMPSYHEGMSNVCLEAAATGRPVLASAIPGCRETFDDQVSGFAFPPKDGPALAKALQMFLELPYEEKARMGQAGRQKVEREFDRQIVISAYLDEIQKVKAK